MAARHDDLTELTREKQGLLPKAFESAFIEVNVPNSSKPPTYTIFFPTIRERILGREAIAQLGSGPIRDESVSIHGEDQKFHSLFGLTIDLKRYEAIRGKLPEVRTNGRDTRPQLLAAEVAIKAMMKRLEQEFPNEFKAIKENGLLSRDKTFLHLPEKFRSDVAAALITVSQRNAQEIQWSLDQWGSRSVTGLRISELVGKAIARIVPEGQKEIDFRNREDLHSVDESATKLAGVIENNHFLLKLLSYKAYYLNSEKAPLIAFSDKEDATNCARALNAGLDVHLGVVTVKQITKHPRSNGRTEDPASHSILEALGESSEAGEAKTSKEQFYIDLSGVEARLREIIRKKVSWKRQYDDPVALSRDMLHEIGRNQVLSRYSNGSFAGLGFGSRW